MARGEFLEFLGIRMSQNNVQLVFDFREHFLFFFFIAYKKEEVRNKKKNSREISHVLKTEKKSKGWMKDRTIDDEGIRYMREQTKEN